MTKWRFLAGKSSKVWYIYKIYICICIPKGSRYGIYANIGGILMGSMLPYIAYMDPMGIYTHVPSSWSNNQTIKVPVLDG